MQSPEREQHLSDTKSTSDTSVPIVTSKDVLQIHDTLVRINTDLSPDLEEEQRDLDNLLSLINRSYNRNLYSQELLLKLLDILKLPPQLSSDIETTLGQLRKHKLTAEQAQQLVQYTRRNTVLIQKSLSLKDFELLTISTPAIYKKRERLLRAKDILTSCDKIEFTLFTDGQELITLEKDNKKYILREFATTLSSNEITRRFKQEIPGLPKTDISIVEDSGAQRRYVLAMTQKLPGAVNDKKKIIDQSRKLLDSIGFVVDLNHQNFMHDMAGNVYYIDGDLIEYLITSPSLAANDNSRHAFERELDEYLTSGKKSPLAA